MEEAVEMLKKKTKQGWLNIPGRIVQADGEDKINILHKICNKT